VKRRDLSGEERDLWALATRDVKPAKKKRKGRAAASPPAVPRDSSFVARAKGRAPQDEAALVSKRILHPEERPSSGRVTKDAARARAPVSVRALGGGDPSVDRRAAKGLIPIDARLDLHGMTEPAAHTRVTRFILGSREEGLRLVLVITGKGSRGVSGIGGEGRGVIRARFLDWIETAPLRGAIARVAQAKPKDGGAGAFYVFLKRKTRG
jgi:DNA-nicking Smr family endonuclease